ncbi:hypothetical protein OESDEN_12254 [Oesophagostomum dentatum]|uniref:Uncharacterized protein n=1 Tax=Oesophagostomum dentatum TaxID=61180 RepID=A0A0B1SRK9_OESDE|nr:hypothetical protein OESDEN_12254 [Oesophagostomum dentatum]
MEPYVHVDSEEEIGTADMYDIFAFELIVFLIFLSLQFAGASALLTRTIRKNAIPPSQTPQ